MKQKKYFFEKKIQNGRLELIDAEGIDVAQPIWR